MQMPSLMPEPGSLFDRITTVMLANMLWFVCSIPIITLPASTAGLFAVLAPLARNDDAEIFSSFFGTMRRQWLKSTVIFAIDGGIGLIIILNFNILNKMNPPDPVFWFSRSIYIFLIMALLLVNLYLWPLLVLFDLRLQQLLNMSIKLAFGHLLWSMLMLGMALLPLVLVLFVPPLLSIIGILSVTVLIANWGAWQIIKQYATPEDLAGLNRS